MGNILYKYGWNRSLDNKVMNLYLAVCPHKRRTQNTFNETLLVQNVLYISSNFAVVFQAMHCHINK